MRAYRLPLTFLVCVLVFSTAAIADGSPARVARDIYLFEGELPAARQPDGNSIVLIAPEGLIVADTGRHTTHTMRLAEFADAKHRTIAAIINTHWHLDHSGGNVLLRERYPQARVYASDAIFGALKGFLQDYRSQLADAIAHSKEEDDSVRAWKAEIQLVDGGKALAPDIVVDVSKSMTIAGRLLNLHLVRDAVTSGDIWIDDPFERVIISGDLVTLPVPFFDTACPRQWELALRQIGKTSFKTLLPGHGRPLNKTQFENYRLAFSNLLSCADSKQPESECIDRWTRDSAGLANESERAKIPAMLDYYFKSVLRASTRDRYCRSER